MYHLNIQEHPTYRLIHLSGELPAEAHDEFRRALAAACTEPFCSRLLVDLRQWAEAETTASAVNLFRYQAQVSNHPGCKLAILGSAGQTSSYSHFQSLALRRFCQAQFFDDLRSAEDWLQTPAYDPLQTLLEQEGPRAVLTQYGLQVALSESDDPALWAAALLRHWPPPDDPELLTSALRFTVGRLPISDTPASGLSGMETLATWYFTRLDETHLSASTTLPPEPPPSAPASASSLFALPLSFGMPGMNFHPWNDLGLSHSSQGTARALVYKGDLAGALIGSGATRWWVRLENGEWQETEETFSRWIS